METPPVTIFFALSIVALAVGPAVLWIAKRTGLALGFLDGFSFLSIGGLVLLHALPEAFHHAGWFAIGAAVLGFMGPSWLEHRLHHAASSAHKAALYAGIVGLAVHAMLDGAALAVSGPMLSVAIVLHRIPVSLAVCQLLVSKRKWGAALFALTTIGIATALGFAIGFQHHAFHHVSFGIFQGAVAGALLHVIVHQRRPNTSLPRIAENISAAFGSVCGVVLIVAISGMGEPHHPEIHDMQNAVWNSLLSLTGASAPALLLAYFGAGMLDAFMPRATVKWMQRGSTLSQSLRGVAFGLPLPICSCGVIPLYRGLVLKGTPAAAAMAFLVATPELGIDAVLLSIPLLGGPFTLIRVIAAAAVAILAGWFVGRLTPKVDAPHAKADDSSKTPVHMRILQAAKSGYGDVVDNTGPWILFGLVIAAIGASALNEDALVLLPNLDVPLWAILGIPIYVCASGATPLVAMLLAKGVSFGAALAFLLTGPATNITTFGVLSKLHGRATALRFGITVTSLAIAIGYLTNTILVRPKTFSVTAHAHDHLSVFQWVCTVILAALFAISFFRQGPRGFAAQVYAIADENPEQEQHHCCH